MNMIELHILQSFPVNCLNRDDVGAPKTAFFGGCQRARVSSQCWKRSIRMLTNEYDADLFAGQRTRFVVRAIEQAYQAKGLDEAKAHIMASVTADALGKLDNEEKGTVKTLLYFSSEELNLVVDAMLQTEYQALLDAVLAEADEKKRKKKIEPLAKLAKKAVKQLSSAVKDAADIALFGRMVADPSDLTLEGAGLFSHALSTHQVSNEIDFFSAVDDKNTDDAGAGHIGTLEYNSACYYRYVGLNVDLLKDDAHLGHFSPEEQAQVIRLFLKATILAVPPARRNSMFAYNPPAYILGLAREGQPLSLANAFEQAVCSRDGYVQPSVEKMEEHWATLKQMYSMESLEIRMPSENMDNLITALIKGSSNE